MATSIGERNQLAIHGAKEHEMSVENRSPDGLSTDIIPKGHDVPGVVNHRSRTIDSRDHRCRLIGPGSLNRTDR